MYTVLFKYRLFTVLFCVCVDLAQQIAEAGDFLLQVFGLDNQLVADSLGLLFGVQ